MQFTRVRDEFCAGQDGTDRAGTVEAFAVAPLALGELGGAAGDVVGGRVAEDVVQGLGLGDVFTGLGDDDGEFGFVVCRVAGLGVFRDDGGVGVRVCEGGGGLAIYGVSRGSVGEGDGEEVFTGTGLALAEHPS